MQKQVHCGICYLSCLLLNSDTIFYMGNWLNFWDFEIAISRDRVTFELHLNCIFLFFNMLFQMSLFSRYSDFFFFVLFFDCAYLSIEPHTHTHRNITKSSFQMKSISNIKFNKQNRAVEVLPILSVWACDFASFMLNKLWTTNWK